MPDSKYHEGVILKAKIDLNSNVNHRINSLLQGSSRIR